MESLSPSASRAPASVAAPSDAAAPAGSRKLYWAGWVLSLLPVPLFLLSAWMKFKMPPDAADGFAHLGWPASLAVPLGILELACVAIYLIPQTAVLGAILITGYLGGATATHVRVGDSTFWMPVVLGVVLWLGIFLREPRLWRLVPLRR